MNPTTSKSQRPGLQIINQWFQDRVQNRIPRQDIVALHTQFVENILARLTRTLGLAASHETIVTVRSSFRKQSYYLRPVYSQPEQLRTFFVDPTEQEPFSYNNKRKAFRGVVLLSETKGNNAPFTFSALYEMRRHHEETNGYFVERINKVLAKWLKIEGLKERTKRVNFCFFAGRNKSHVPAKFIELQHVLAIYFSGTKTDLSNNQKTRNTVQDIIQELFEGLDLISHIDARNFEAEGLQLVADLLPEFSRDNIAPADKIAFAVERLGQLLTHHMIGRHGGQIGSKPAKLFFIATTFERQDDKRKSLHPRLEVYPHVYRHDYWSVSFFVTHRSIPTASKFLLWRYLSSKRHRIVETTSASKDIGAAEKLPSIKLSPGFGRMFESDKLGTEPFENWQDTITPSKAPDFLHLTRDQFKPSRKTPWTALNRAAEQGCRSIAAFVVEGRVIHTRGNVQTRCLPRGIIAIESHFEDGFSDADIDSLRIVFRGLASLVRLISHQHSPIDYRSLIARTFDQDAEPAMRDIPNVLRLLFLVQKLDAELFHKLLPECRNTPERYGLNGACLPALAKIGTICPGFAHPTQEKRAEILRERMAKMQDLLLNPNEKQVRDLLLSENVLAFLEACPENFTWASYLACMAQTLGDRIDAGTEDLPEFSRMVPGFSASGMFMAMVEGELRQVVKLSTAEKLRKEARLYRKWVRYRLVNAARISLGTGLAFETTGAIGRNSAHLKPKQIEHTAIVLPKKTKNAESDGALVSDLVSGVKPGQDRVWTFLDVVAKCIGGLKEANMPSSEKIAGEIANVFGANAELWRTDKELSKKSTIPAVLSAFRVPKEKPENERRDFEGDIARLQGMRTSGKSVSFALLFRQWGQKQDRNVLSRLAKEHSRVCHGDLNARNLTWAEGLQSFFLIDFEHVGPAPNGTDQFRLVVSLVTEFWQGLDSIKSPDDSESRSEFKNLYAALTNGLDYLKKIFEILIGRGGGAPLSDIADHTARKYPGGLTEILKTILMTVDPDRKLSEPKWRFHWALMLLCSAAKEFSYSCRRASAITLAEAKAILTDNKLDSSTIPDLEDAVRRYKPSRTIPPSFKGDCMYHFVAGRLLLGFADALDYRDNA